MFLLALILFCEVNSVLKPSLLMPQKCCLIKISENTLEGLECVLFCFVYFAKGLAKAKCGGI